jgi:hypothetical protein
VVEAALGPNHAWVAHPLAFLGRLRLDRGDAAGAAAALERAVALRAAHLPADHPDLAAARADLAACRAALVGR